MRKFADRSTKYMFLTVGYYIRSKKIRVRLNAEIPREIKYV